MSNVATEHLGDDIHVYYDGSHVCIVVIRGSEAGDAIRLSPLVYAKLTEFVTELRDLNRFLPHPPRQP